MIADFDHLSLTYERNLSDEIAQGQTINALCNLLGIEAIQASSKLKKIAPRSFDEFIENAEEMVRTIEKTPFGTTSELLTFFIGSLDQRTMISDRNTEHRSAASCASGTFPRFSTSMRR